MSDRTETVNSTSVNIRSPYDIDLSVNGFIRASAGTGKTYSMTALFARLITEGIHFSDDGSEGFAPLDLRRILVVTFTEKGTADLKRDIRKRIDSLISRVSVVRMTERFSESEIAEIYGDSGNFETQFIKRIGSGENAVRILKILTQAANDIDQASVFTIHGFCSRMLRANAFESGELFGLQVNEDTAELLTEASREVWRESFYPRGAENEIGDKEAGLVHSVLVSPDSMASLFSKLGTRLSDGTVFNADCPEENGRRLSPREVLERMLDGSRNGLADAVKKISVNMDIKTRKGDFNRIRDIIAGLRQETDSVAIMNGLSELWKTVRSLADEIRKAQDKAIKEGNGPYKLKDWEAEVLRLSENPELRDASCRAAREKNELRMSFVRALSEKFRGRLKALSSLTTDDLLTDLRDALESEHGRELAARIRSLLPVAMIDESQDTDSVQSEIFRKIYLSDEAKAEHARIFIVGDPKQSIYSFRGADVYTYNSLGKDISENGGCHYSLQRNYRSSADVIEAVNLLFRNSPGSSPLGEGISYDEISSLKESELVISTASETRTAAPFEICTCSIPEKSQSDVFLEKAARSAALEVQRLLGRHRRDGEDEQYRLSGRAVQPEDIAVLVSAQYQADAVIRALKDVGLRGVYYSDRSSVYSEPEAQSMLFFLSALKNPSDFRTLRSIVAEKISGLTIEGTMAILQDEGRIISLTDLLKKCRADLDSQGGIMKAVTRFVTARGVFSPDGSLLDSLVSADGKANRKRERSIVNFLQLAELLNDEFEDRDSVDEKIDRLRDLMGDLAERSSDSQRLRLDSAQSGVIKIITIHIAKGQEFPIVLLPFVSAGLRELLPEETRFHTSHTISDAGSEKHTKLPGLYSRETDRETEEKARTEETAEEIRKLYVALTRAKYLNWVFAASYEKQTESPWSVLLESAGIASTDALDEIKPDPAGRDPELLRKSPLPERLFTMGSFPENDDAETNAEAEAEPEQGNGGAAAQNGAADFPAPSAQEFTGSIDRSWHRHSFSSVTHNSRSGHGIEQEERDEPAEADAAEGEEEAAARKPFLSPESFPRGTFPGLFLHKVLELIDFPEMAAPESDSRSAWRCRRIISEQLMRKSLGDESAERRWNTESGIRAIEAWLRNVVTTPLFPGTSLSDITMEHRLSELKFVMPADFSTSAYNSAVDAERQRTDDDFVRRFNTIDMGEEDTALRGMWTGEIDLLLEKDGKYYVIDYKSNLLEDYDRKHLDDDIIKSRYDVQFISYTLALHRFLRSRIKDYDYDRHIGGIAYLFLRGMKGAGSSENSTPGVRFLRLSRELIEDLDGKFSGGSSK